MGATILKTDLKNNGNIPVFSATEGDEIFGFVNDSNVILEKNDFVIPARGNSIGHVYLVEGLSTCTQTTIYAKPLYPNIYEARYFLYFQKGLREHLFQFDRTAIPQITVDQVKNNYATIPSKTTQTAIASYLDRKTAEIDELIAQKERLIELYEEEKTAIINQAVTKGIDPDAKLKDSGVDWLGEIPEGWVVKRLRYVGNCQNGVSKGADYFGTGFPFVSYSDVYNNFVLSQNVEGLANSTEIDQVNYSVIKGDIFFTRTSETIEEIGISSTCLETINRAIFSGFLIRFRPFDSILFEGFSKYFFRSKLHRLFFVKEMNLVTRASLSQELLKRLPVTLPPFLEQCEIASYLDQATSSIEAKIEKTKKIIELQKEYRTAMISEVVTGKIKVTEETTP
jgi:type I restriction enzyme S subunit